MEKAKSKNVLLAIMGVLIVTAIVLRIIIIRTEPVFAVLQLTSLVFTSLYLFWLYKKPHGNALKYAILIFAFANIIGSSICVLDGKVYQIPKVMSLAAVCYCAGRLNRIDQNKFIMPVIGVVFLAVSIILVRERILNNTGTFINLFRAFNCSINYIVLMIAYFVRYKEHKEAGNAPESPFDTHII